MTTTVQTTDLARGLTDALRQTFTLYRRTHLAHWNVKGPHFQQLHAAFEQQYRELWDAVDLLAERVRALGVDVPPDALDGDTVDLPHDAMAIVKALAKDHRAASKAFWALESVATEAGDPATADLAISRIRAHDQVGWMLEATAT